MARIAAPGDRALLDVGIRRWRAVISLTAGLVLTGGAGVVGRQLLRGATSSGADPASVLAGCAAAAAALIAGWLTLCLLLCLLARGPGAAGVVGARVRDRLAPALVRRWAAVVIGASTLGGGMIVPPSITVAAVGEAAPGLSTPPAPGWSPAERQRPVGSAPTRTVPGPGWVPRRPPAPAQGDAHLLTSGRRAADPEVDAAVVVRRGDSLWSIAAARLGAGATDGEIARSWPRWYAANTGRIGTDPHTLHPGMRLTPPREQS